ncbi:hypothetical protein HD806DRAFT_164554 [Xylariaceae sp. AK1471]|nr:hypothetical protein HD806DRAFT_164554 [Xylariaceae sp. AK1471]
MSTNSGSVFSETLQGITNAKLEELSKRRSEFETTKANIISRLENEKDPLIRLGILSQGVKDSYAMKTTKAGDILPGQSRHPDLELELKNLDRFMAQSKYDPSVTPQLMRTWEESLLRHLNMQSSKFEYASLYAQLVTEWLSTEKAGSGAEDDVAMLEGIEGFEDVGDLRKKEARQGWEQVVFEPANVDENALKAYLLQLFGLQNQEKPAKAKGLQQLRNKLTEFENTLAAPKQFNSTTLTWVINGLLASDLMTDERREVLRDFISNQTILAEVADVLNMRLAALGTWSWGESVALEQQRKITGVYNVLMHEDVLQAIFLEYVGVKWSVFLKGAFRDFRKFNRAWKSSARSIRQLDQQRRGYYLDPAYTYRRNSVQSARDRIYRKHYFMASLMGHDTQQRTSFEGEEEAEYTSHELENHQPQLMQLQQQNKKRLYMAQAQQQASFSGMAWSQQPTMSYQASRPPPPPNPYRVGFEVDEDDDDDTNNDSENRRPMEDKQRLIRLLSTEIAINTKLHGEITAFHSAFESWNSLLPHETILTIMSLLGVSETWIAFFSKFLRAPLKFLDDGAATAPRTRRRGTPASHVLSEIFGESILFCLDFAVNQETGGHNLHRMHDDFWFWSRDHDVAKKAWKAVSDFVNATRTYINFKKSGTVRISRDPTVQLEIDESLPKGDICWGFLKLSTQTGKFEIDQATVDKHIVDLRRQLADKRKSVISFIQAWNTFAATFFTSNFGKPANCFGRAHVDQILATHQRIQREVFSSPSSSLLAGEEPPKEPITGVADYIKHLLRSRFGVSDIPDAYLFFPVELGGLDLRSPFISILPVREAVLSDPDAVLDKFLEAERDDYASKKLTFERGLVRRNQGAWEPQDPREREQFMSFDEYARYREDLHYSFTDNLESVFDRLLEAPAEEGGIREASAAVRGGIGALANLSRGYGQGHALKGIIGDWSAMDPYWRWVAQLYGPEAISRFGGLNIVEPGLLPMGMVSIFRDKRVKWQG